MFDDDEAHLSGAAFLSNLRVFEERFGQSAVRRALARLAADRIAEYEAAVPVAWVRASTADLIYGAIAEEVGEDLFAIYPGVVEQAIDNILRTLWRSMAPPGTDELLVTRAAQFYAKGHDRGRLVARLLAPGHAELELHDWPDASELRLLGIASATTAILTHGGRQQVTVQRRRTEDGALFEVRWRVEALGQPR
jgi:hypothetical protein